MDISCLRCSIKGNIALQCSLVLSGIKPSNLLIYSNECSGCISEELKNTGLEHTKLYEGEKESVSIIYNRFSIENLINDTGNIDFIKKYGYIDTDIDNILVRLSDRYTSFRNRKSEFPHEIGLLLGYPIEDVVGFIENNGQNFIYSGYWKVYKNAEEKIKMFAMYKEIKRYFIKQIANGKKLYQISSEFKNIDTVFGF